MFIILILSGWKIIQVPFVNITYNGNTYEVMHLNHWVGRSLHQQIFGSVGDFFMSPTDAEMVKIDENKRVLFIIDGDRVACFLQEKNDDGGWEIRKIRYKIIGRRVNSCLKRITFHRIEYGKIYLFVADPCGEKIRIIEYDPSDNVLDTLTPLTSDKFLSRGGGTKGPVDVASNERGRIWVLNRELHQIHSWFIDYIPSAQDTHTYVEYWLRGHWSSIAYWDGQGEGNLYMTDPLLKKIVKMSNLYSGRRIDKVLNFSDKSPTSIDVTEKGVFVLFREGYIHYYDHDLNLRATYYSPDFYKPHSISAYGNEFCVIDDYWWGMGLQYFRVGYISDGGDGGDGGGDWECPILYVWDGDEYKEDNNILPTPYPYPIGQRWVDVYRLMVRPVADNLGRYLFKIVENGDNYTYIDRVELIGVSEPSGVSSCVLDTQIVPYEVWGSIRSAYDNYGIGAYSFVTSDEKHFPAFAGDFIKITLDDPLPGPGIIVGYNWLKPGHDFVLYDEGGFKGIEEPYYISPRKNLSWFAFPLPSGVVRFTIHFGNRRNICNLIPARKLDVALSLSPSLPSKVEVISSTKEKEVIAPTVLSQVDGRTVLVSPEQSLRLEFPSLPEADAYYIKIHGFTSPYDNAIGMNEDKAATGYNNARRLIKIKDVIYLAYTSGGRIWITCSYDEGVNWELPLPLGYGVAPALCGCDTAVFVGWLEPKLNGYILRYNILSPFTFSPVSDTGFILYSVSRLAPSFVYISSSPPSLTMIDGKLYYVWKERESFWDPVITWERLYLAVMDGGVWDKALLAERSKAEFLPPTDVYSPSITSGYRGIRIFSSSKSIRFEPEVWVVWDPFEERISLIRLSDTTKTTLVEMDVKNPSIDFSTGYLYLAWEEGDRIRFQQRIDGVVKFDTLLSGSQPLVSSSVVFYRDREGDISFLYHGLEDIQDKIKDTETPSLYPQGIIGEEYILSAWTEGDGPYYILREKKSVDVYTLSEDVGHAEPSPFSAFRDTFYVLGDRFYESMDVGKDSLVYAVPFDKTDGRYHLVLFFYYPSEVKEPIIYRVKLDDVSLGNVRLIPDSLFVWERKIPRNVIRDSLIWIRIEKIKGEKVLLSAFGIDRKRHLLPHLLLRRTPLGIKTEFYGITPNITSDRILVRFSLGWREEVDIRIYDVIGRCRKKVLIEKNRGIHSLSIELTDLPPGTYFLFFNAGEIQEKRKFILIR